jgi:hypothetical protein
MGISYESLAKTSAQEKIINSLPKIDISTEDRLAQENKNKRP